MNNYQFNSDLKTYKKDGHTIVIEGQMQPESVRNEIQNYQDAKKFNEKEMNMTCK